ncbi:MAG: hypothetical protein RIR17_1855 [Planctomycetota bacterium]
MKFDKWRCLVSLFLITLNLYSYSQTEPAKSTLQDQVSKSGNNQGEIQKFMEAVPQEQKGAMEFLLLNMPEKDLTNLSSDYLLTNHGLAFQARKVFPWAMNIPEELFLNYVLPYANLDEKRDPWRKEFFELCQPIVKDCKTPSEAVQKLNNELFKKLHVKYAPQRRSPNLSPKESIAQGTASCTGLSIMLCNACKSVGIPARIVGTPNWFDKRGNHTWVEIWDNGWHFTGACEPDPKGLDRGWFVGDASRAVKENPEHAIYATSFKKTDLHFPLVWNRESRIVPAENVTERYAKPSIPNDTFRLSIRVKDSNGKRVSVMVRVTSPDDATFRLDGKSKGESADLNDFLSLELPPAKNFVLEIEGSTKTLRTGKPGERQLLDVEIPLK